MMVHGFLNGPARHGATPNLWMLCLPCFMENPNLKGMTHDENHHKVVPQVEFTRSVGANKYYFTRLDEWG